MSKNRLSDDDFLGIVLAVALGIGIAHDDGWTGSKKADASTSPVTTTQDIIKTVVPKLEPRPF